MRGRRIVPADQPQVRAEVRQHHRPDSEVALLGHPLFSAALRRPALGRRLLAGMTGPGAAPAVREANRRLFAGLARDVRAAAFRSSQHLDLETAPVQVPALVLCGDRDSIIGPDANRSLAEALPLGRLRILPGAGHQLPLERPDEVAQAIEDLVAAAV